MKKLTDQELDSVFKNAAEGYETAFDPAAWDAMNAKLDQPRPALWKRWIPFALLGLVIFSTGVWVGIYMNEKPTLNQVPAEPQKEKIIEQKNINAQENQNQTPEVTNQIVGQKEGEIAKSSDVNHGNNLKRSITSEKKEIENSKPVIVADHSNLVDETKFILQGAKTSNEFEEIIAANPTDSVAQEVVEVKADTTQSDTEPKKKKQSASSHPIFLRALVSPDFSSISYSSATSTGSNYALLVEYQLTDRWSVATGGIWSMKKYATDEEFTYGKYTADRMTGECRILDIPLNIYYQIRPQEKFSFSAGLGLSSYIMQEEEYTYTFDLPSGSRDFSDYIEGENNEWFKVLNLSLGMQYQIAPRIQLQVEPFLKAPLSGVGEWDVLLSSMGIFMGLKYKIN